MQGYLSKRNFFQKLAIELMDKRFIKIMKQIEKLNRNKIFFYLVKYR